ncbi:MAG: hypothetical protein K2K87_12095 [Lachnospiraceae bacterium]|nr:hypothetical protein [Lachnospiraceae bacterium]
MIVTKQYETDTVKKAEFVAKIFSNMPQENAERVMELANSYLDGINTGIRLSATMNQENRATQTVVKA